ncbi:hypothetical protein RND71_017069 [Anisodus tanguticus]|uniref:Uncharacterized protein n=1 Tax=Anisodus tanguticus TaxID=243964 RepID=A0AAE1S1K3_9SOLA|nr:hypothetical protein RND71_017069 [Anisodus tanguticus]
MKQSKITGPIAIFTRAFANSGLGVTDLTHSLNHSPSPLHRRPTLSMFNFSVFSRIDLGVTDLNHSLNHSPAPLQRRPLFNFSVFSSDLHQCTRFKKSHHSNLPFFLFPTLTQFKSRRSFYKILTIQQGMLYCILNLCISL